MEKKSPQILNIKLAQWNQQHQRVLLGLFSSLWVWLLWEPLWQPWLLWRHFILSSIPQRPILCSMRALCIHMMLFLCKPEDQYISTLTPRNRYCTTHWCPRCVQNHDLVLRWMVLLAVPSVGLELGRVWIGLFQGWENSFWKNKF